jgi:hypothetical protein
MRPAEIFDLSTKMRHKNTLSFLLTLLFAALALSGCGGWIRQPTSPAPPSAPAALPPAAAVARRR